MQGLEKIRSCEKVILFHFPLSPYSKKAVNLLIDECEKLKDEEEKLYCYETLRSGLIQVKSFYQPYRDIIEDSKFKIAHLRATLAIKWQFNRYSIQDYDSLYRDNLALIQHENAPSVFWSLVVVFSLIGWISSGVFTILKGFKEPTKKKFIIEGIISFILFFSLWLLGLWMA